MTKGPCKPDSETETNCSCQLQDMVPSRPIRKGQSGGSSAQLAKVELLHSTVEARSTTHATGFCLINKLTLQHAALYGHLATLQNLPLLDKLLACGTCDVLPEATVKPTRHPF